MNDYLRQWWAQREWSQARLVEEPGVSRQTVNAIETGKYDRGLPLAFRIVWGCPSSIESVFFEG